VRTERVEYIAYLISIDRDEEVEVGKFDKLSRALIRARVACREAGVSNWDWVVDKYIGNDAESLKHVQRRSSVGGFEPL
jgi:hypothetical protein